MTTGKASDMIFDVSNSKTRKEKKIVSKFLLIRNQSVKINIYIIQFILTSLIDQLIMIR